jgi:hypothetical protein
VFDRERRGGRGEKKEEEKEKKDRPGTREGGGFDAQYHVEILKRIAGAFWIVPASSDSRVGLSLADQVSKMMRKRGR